MDASCWFRKVNSNAICGIGKKIEVFCKLQRNILNNGQEIAAGQGSRLQLIGKRQPEGVADKELVRTI